MRPRTTTFSLSSLPLNRPPPSILFFGNSESESDVRRAWKRLLHVNNDFFPTLQEQAPLTAESDTYTIVYFKSPGPWFFGRKIKSTQSIFVIHTFLKRLEQYKCFDV